MKRTLLLIATLLIAASTQAMAAISTELFLDAGGGVTATIDVDNLGIVTCTGTCGGLVFPSSITPHSTLQVTGTLGQFTINATGVGGIDAIAPTLQNLNQIEASTTGSGTLFSQFTDTDYCMGGGICFGQNFVLSASTVNDTAIASSTTDFGAFGSAANTVPASTLIATLTGLTGLSDSKATIVSNTIGTGGSLTSATTIAFTGAGRVQANFQISSFVPEPASIVLFGAVLSLVALKLRRKTQAQS